MREWGFIFCLRFRRHFFRHTDFLRFKISKKIFFKNLDFGYHRKMHRLVPCIPIFRWVFWLKVKKEYIYAIMLKITLVLFKIYVLMWKQGISRLERQIPAKHTAFVFALLMRSLYLLFVYTRISSSILLIDLSATYW